MSKQSEATRIYQKSIGQEFTRSQMMQIFIDELHVSKAHASTLYHNAKKAAVVEPVADQAFIFDNFSWDGMYLMYHPKGRWNTPHEEVKFVARFKYGRKPWKGWANFMVKNFTQNEYFTLAEEHSPLRAMESKGYLLPHIRKELKAKGYPQTPAGFKKMIEDEIEREAA